MATPAAGTSCSNARKAVDRVVTEGKFTRENVILISLDYFREGSGKLLTDLKHRWARVILVCQRIT